MFLESWQIVEWTAASHKYAFMSDRCLLSAIHLLLGPSRTFTLDWKRKPCTRSPPMSHLLHYIRYSRFPVCFFFSFFFGRMYMPVWYSHWWNFKRILIGLLIFFPLLSIIFLFCCDVFNCGINLTEWNCTIWLYLFLLYCAHDFNGLFGDVQKLWWIFFLFVTIAHFLLRGISLFF